MKPRATFMPRFNLRAGALTSIEEKVLRMRYGLAGYSFMPVGQASPAAAKAADELSHLEARLRAQAALNPLHRRR